MYSPSSYQKTFTSDGTVKTLEIPSGYDWIRVQNLTAAAQATVDLPYEFFWTQGMTTGIKWTKLGNVANDPLTVDDIVANEGFFKVDSSTNSLSAAIAITSATNITEPVFDTGTTTNLSNGTIVRLTGMTGQENLSGYDFAIDTIVGSTSFKMAAALATAPGAAASAGAYRIVQWDPIIYPRWRYIANITAAASAVITTTVPSGYSVGQKVTVIVPTSAQSGTSDYGMTEINNLVGTITAVTDTVGTQTITVDIDSSGFTAFTFPTAAKATGRPLSKAIVVPAGYDTSKAIAQSVNIGNFSYKNKGFIGVRLLNPNSSADGIAGPAGALNDVMFVQAGLSTVV